MYEPLLDLELPDKHTQTVHPPRTTVGSSASRRVVVVGEVLQIPDSYVTRSIDTSLARVNVAAIVSALLDSDEVGLVASGDHDAAEPFPRPGVLESRAERARRKDLELALVSSDEIAVSHYLSNALDPRVPVVGVNDLAVLEAGQKARSLRDQNVARYRTANGHIPLLDALGNVLEQAKEKHYPAELQCAEQLLNLVNMHGPVAMVRSLSELLGLATDAGIRLSSFPAITALHNLCLAEASVPAGELRAAVKDLRSIVLTTLLRPDEKRTRPLFDREVRHEAMRLVDDPNRNWSLNLEQPLRDIANRSVRRMMASIVDALRRNESGSPALVRELLDLASLLYVDTQRFASLRTVTAAQLAMPPIKRYLREMQDFAELLWQRLLPRASPAAQRLHVLNRCFHHLCKAMDEAVTPDDAFRIQRHPPSAADLVQSLEELGYAAGSEMHARAADFDRSCTRHGLDYCTNVLKHASVMAKSLTKAMNEVQADTAVLICGGFHAQLIAEELGRDYACSVVIPRLSDQADSEHQWSLNEMAAAAQRSGPDFTIRLLGLPPTSQPTSAGFETERSWATGRRLMALLSAPPLLHYVYGTSQLPPDQMRRLQKCRVCLRQLPYENGEVVAAHGEMPDLVLWCPRCRAYLCAHCAAKEPVAMFTGHSPGEAGDGPARLTCNVHGLRLVRDPDKPVRHIGRPHVGHGWHT